MKQNQQRYGHPSRQAATCDYHDLLRSRAKCNCSLCLSATESINPELNFDHQLQRLQQNQNQINDMVEFLNKVFGSKMNLEKVRFLDVVVPTREKGNYALYYDTKTRLVENVNLKNFILERKNKFDVEYLKGKYERDHHDFIFSQFDHKSQNQIKKFEDDLKLVNPHLKRVAIVKLRGQSQQVLSKHEFVQMFDSKNRSLQELEYVQVFPILHEEEQHSYVERIKYFREEQCCKPAFKLANAHVTTWTNRNESLELLEATEFKDLFGEQAKEERELLLYQTYKLFIYYEEISNLRVEEALIEYITNDNGLHFYLKCISYLKLHPKAILQPIRKEILCVKEYAKEEHIVLKDEMQKQFSSFQQQYQAINEEKLERYRKQEDDRSYSDFVYQTLIGSTSGEGLRKMCGKVRTSVKDSQT